MPATLIVDGSQVEYPRLDYALVLAIVLDYDDPTPHVEEIRRQLFELQLTSIPDEDEAPDIRGDANQLDRELTALDLGPDGYASSATDRLLERDGLDQSKSSKGSNGHSTGSSSKVRETSTRVDPSLASSSTSTSSTGQESNVEELVDLLKSMVADV